MRTILVLRREREDDWQGNLLVDRVLGAEVRFVDTKDPAEMDRVLRATADEVRAAGQKPFVMNHAASFAMGSAVAYVFCCRARRWARSARGSGPTNTPDGVSLARSCVASRRDGYRVVPRTTRRLR